MAAVKPDPTNSPGVGRKNRSIHRDAGLWSDIKTLQWIINPASSLKLLAIPVLLYVNWAALAPFVAPDQPNPFAPFLFISYPLPDSSPDDPRYAKGRMDFLFIAYHIIFFSFLRQTITVTLGRPIAKYFGVKKNAKIERFGEQLYAMVYFFCFGVCGTVIMSKLPTWWYRTEHFWIDYPHWQLIPDLKRYYMMHLAYWLQQLVVLLMGLEKPRKDYRELVLHHFVTLWLVGWSYVMNLTFIGNAVFISMDLPDIFLAISKLLNYIQWERAKVVAFGLLVIIWSYFRHWINFLILWSVWAELELLPVHGRQWNPSEGVYLAWWMRWQMLLGLGALQVLNLFWYFLILRILVRTIVTKETTDERSDDEDQQSEKED